MTNSSMQWKTQVVSDVIRDGLGLELVRSDNQVVAEIFRCDADHTVSISLFVETLPLNAIELMLMRAKEALDPFEDGVRFSEAGVDT